VIDLINTARTPVDIGGPVIFDLPTEARGPGVMDGSSPQAKTLGTHVTIVGPFAPGTTHVEVGFGLPYSGGSVRLEQKWPLALPQVTLLLQRVGTSDVHSSQLSGRRDMADQGQPVLVAEGPALPAGAVLALDFVGLPHRSVWPRYTALALALLFVVGGLWVAARRPPPAPRVPRAKLETERGRLLDRLAGLDRDRAAGRLAESACAAEREATVARLSQIYAALDESASAA
jgi:hypothetical protein